MADKAKCRLALDELSRMRALPPEDLGLPDVWQHEGTGRIRDTHARMKHLTHSPFWERIRKCIAELIKDVLSQDDNFTRQQRDSEITRIESLHRYSCPSFLQTFEYHLTKHISKEDGKEKKMRF